MWLELKDVRGPIFFNLDTRLDIRTMTSAELVGMLADHHSDWSVDKFGQTNELLLVLMGPTLTEFEIVASFHAGEGQDQKMAYVNQAIRQGLANGTRLLNLNDLVQEAKAQVQSAVASAPA